MNSFHQLLTERRSIRKYTSEELDADDVKLILEAGLMAPSSKSSRAWQFIVVDDKDMLMRLSQCKPAGAQPIAGAAIAVVVAIDPSKTEPWIEDASAAAMCMLLQAADLGLGGCWIQVRDRYLPDGTPSEEYVKELLSIPEEFPIVCILSFGHKAEERKAIDTDKLLWEKVHIGTWKNID